MIQCIVSMTSHGNRIAQCPRTIFSILRGVIQVKVVLTIYKDDLIHIQNNEDIYTLVQNKTIDLIIADEDLGPHLKYYYALQKYANANIITIDDDIIYDKIMVKSMLDFYTNNPNMIIANRCHRIYTLDYNKWDKVITQRCGSHYNFATGVGGVLYPAHCFDTISPSIDEILKIKYADDIYLKILELRNSIQVYNAHNFVYHDLHDTCIDSTALYKTNITKNRNNKYLLTFNKDFKHLL